MGYDMTSLFTSNFYWCNAPKETMQSGVRALMLWKNVITVIIRVDMEVLVVSSYCL